MTRKKRPFGRRLSRREVQDLIASGAKPRPDLSATLEQALRTGHRDQPLVYELDHERYLWVRDPSLPGAGTGDIVTADFLHRFLRWMARVDEDYKLGRATSVDHWAYYSTLKEQLVLSIDTLVEQLRSTMARTPDDLDLSLKSLDIVSGYVEGIGVERAQQEVYDQLVAYVGEVLRLRIGGRWSVDSHRQPRYPLLLSEQCYQPLMPINVVWEQLSGVHPVNLKAAAASEVRSKRKPPVPVPAGSVRAAPPEGMLATVPPDAYEIRQRYKDGRPWVIVFTREVALGGTVCRHEAWFHRSGEPFGLTLSHEQSLGGRRFSAGSFVRYRKRQGDGRLSDVKLGEDQEVDGLPCRRGTVVEFHANQRLGSLQLASDREINGIPCAGGDSEVSFHKNGRLSTATLAREHVLIGRSFPPRTQVLFDEAGHLLRAWLTQDWQIDGNPVRAPANLQFDPNGQLTHVQSLAEFRP
jgi:hypothetical protein